MGRLCWTGVLLIPLVPLLGYLVVGGWAGLVIYGGVILPWALRDIWRQAG